jgi:starch synthase
MKVWLPALKAGTGTDVFTVRLREALLARGVEATIEWFPAWMEAVPELMRRVSPPPGTDLIHGNGWTVAPFVGGALPVVDTIHHLVFDPAFAAHRSTAQALYHRLHVLPRERRALRGAAAVTAVSDYVAGTVRTLFGRDDVRAIGNWVDVHRYAPDPERREAAAGERPLRVLWVGNPSRRKGFDLLPALAAALGDEAAIRAVGGLRGDAASVGARNVTWLGRLDEATLVDEYRQCDVLLSTSRYEGYGYSALEAMACGRPVVAFAAGGLVDVVRHGDSGFLSPVEDLEGIVAGLRRLAADPALRARMGRAGRAFAEAQSRNADAYVDVYERVLEAAKRRRSPRARA